MLLACENKNASQGDSKKAEQSKQATEAPKDAKVATAENGKHTESNDVTVDVQKYHNTEKIDFRKRLCDILRSAGHERRSPRNR